MVNYGKLFSIAQMGLAVLASPGYLLARDYKKSIYWLCAGILTYTVTF